MREATNTAPIGVMGNKSGELCAQLVVVRCIVCSDRKNLGHCERYLLYLSRDADLAFDPKVFEQVQERGGHGHPGVRLFDMLAMLNKRSRLQLTFATCTTSRTRVMGAPSCSNVTVVPMYGTWFGEVHMSV